MGRSGAERKRKRREALAAKRSRAPQQPNKFIPTPERANTRVLEAAIADGRRGAHAENRISKKSRKGKKSAEKVRRRIQNIISVPDALEVTIQWENGTKKTFQLPKDGEGSVPGRERSKNIDESPNEEPKSVRSTCGMRAEADAPDEQNPTTDPEVPEAHKTTSDLPVDAMGPESPVALLGTKLDDVGPAKHALSRSLSVSCPEIADSQASEESFHDSQEYPDLGAWEETARCTRGTQTTPKAARLDSAGIPLGYSPELNQPSGDRELDEAADQNNSSQLVLEEPSPQPPESCQEAEDVTPSSPSPGMIVESSAAEHGISDACSQASQELPALHDEPEHPPPTTQLATPYKSSRNKRTYDPYEITPTPPKKRVLRSSGKLFATPPWKMKSEQKSYSAPGATKTPALRRSGLLRGEPVVSEEELVSIFSDPDPELDHVDRDVPKPDMAAPLANSDGALADTSKGNMKKVKDETPVMPPRSRAVREWKDDEGELSDDSNYTGVMSTPLRNYGRTPRIMSQPRPGLISVEKRTPARRTKIRSKFSSRSRRSVSKDAAERIAELPTSPTADSMLSSPGSKASTKPTSPMEEAVSKPVGTAELEQKTRRVSMSLVPGIPLSRGRRGSESKPTTSHCFSNMTPSAAKETPSHGNGIRGSWATGSSDPVHDVEQGCIEIPAEIVPARIEIPIPSFNSLGSRTPGSLQAKPQVEKERRDEKAKRKMERKSKAKEEANNEAKKAPKAEEHMIRKKEEVVEKGVKPRKDRERKTKAKEETNKEAKMARRAEEVPGMKIEEVVEKEVEPRKDRERKSKAMEVKEANKEANQTPRTEQDTGKKSEEGTEKGVKHGKDWVAPEKRTPVPLPPYVAMMGR